MIDENWVPKTKLGKDVFEEKITSIDEVFESGKKIKESQIVDKLLPDIKNELIFIGGSPGKGGGIRRTPTRRTSRMHRSGRRYKVSAFVVVGDENGHVGIGKAESTENRKAINKAIKNAKLNIIPIKRGCGSWECNCNENHSIPLTTRGKSGSAEIVLMPAPRGIGLCVSNEMKKIFILAGITDLWSKSYGNIQNRASMIFAIFDAFKNMNKMKVK